MAPKPFTVYKLPGAQVDVYVRTMGPAGLVTDEGILVHPVDGLPNLLHWREWRDHPVTIDGRRAATHIEADRISQLVFEYCVEYCADTAWQTD